jgi:hypothetical protein
VADIPGALLLTLLLCVTTLGAGEPIVLDNGARVILTPVPGTGAVAVIAAYATGYADDLPGVAQAAHLAEHLRCTAATAGTAVNETFGRLNRDGSANAETLADLTYYDYAVPAGSLRTALEAEAARLTSLRITEDDIAREIPRVRREIDGVAAAPGVFVGKFAAMAAVQAWTHGEQSVDIRLLDAPTPERMAAFIDAHHRVDRLTLIITGDFDPAEAERDARALIGGLPADPAGPAPARDWAALPALRSLMWAMPAKVVLVAMPLEGAGCAPELEALATRAGFALNQHAVVRSVVSSGPGVPLGPMPLFVGVCLRPDADEQEALALLHEALDHAMATDVTRIRSAAASLAAQQPCPDAAAVAAAAEQLVRLRGMRPHVAAAVVMGNHALQSLMRAPTAGCDDDALRASVRRAFARDNRRVLILGPGGG